MRRPSITNGNQTQTNSNLYDLLICAQQQPNPNRIKPTERPTDRPSERINERMNVYTVKWSPHNIPTVVLVIHLKRRFVSMRASVWLFALAMAVER